MIVYIWCAAARPAIFRKPYNVHSSKYLEVTSKVAMNAFGYLSAMRPLRIDFG
jgi:hypothetical protein